MSKRAIHVTLLGLLTIPAIAFARGGWAVISVDDVPDHIVAGEPVHLNYSVRQHGVTLLSGLTGGVNASMGSSVIAGVTTPDRLEGRYAAALVIPQAGSWTIAIASGFGNSEVKLVPIRVVARGAAAPPPLRAFERGRQLFAAKGCVTCHVHRDVNDKAAIAAGPDLTNVRFAADYLPKYLADPTIKPPTRPERMPNPHLNARDITALAAFINAEKGLAGK